MRSNILHFGHFHTAGVPGRYELNENQELYYPAIMRAIAATGHEGYVGQEFVLRNGARGGVAGKCISSVRCVIAEVSRGRHSCSMATNQTYALKTKFRHNLSLLLNNPPPTWQTIWHGFT